MPPAKQENQKTARGKAGAVSKAPRDPDTVLEWVLLTAFALTAFVYLQMSPGTYQDDDLDHFFMARAAFRNPAFLIDPWGRPAFTILYALPAQLGFSAVRFLTVLISVLAAWVTGRTARRLGYRSPALVSGLTVWQPLFLILSFSALVEPLAALGIAGLLYYLAAEKPGRAALVAGLLPVARLELAVLMPLVAVWLVGRRAFRGLPVLAVPLLVWAILGAIAHGDPLWLPHVAQGGRPLTTTGPVHYFQNLISVTGPTVLLGLLLGFLVFVTPGSGPRPKWAAIVWLTLFATLTALTWDKLPIGGSVGFLRHLVMLAPAGALLAAAGFEALVHDLNPVRRAAFLGAGILSVSVTAVFLSHTLEADYIFHPEKDWSKLIGILPPALVVMVASIRPGLVTGVSMQRLGLIFAAAAIAFCVATRHPLTLNGEQIVVKAAIDKLSEVGAQRGRWLANHPWFYHLMKRDRWDRITTPYVTRAALTAARPGDFVFWENHYGWRLYGDVPEDEMRGDPRFQPILDASSGDKQFRIAVFQKIGGE